MVTVKSADSVEVVLHVIISRTDIDRDIGFQFIDWSDQVVIGLPDAIGAGVLCRNGQATSATAITS